VRGDEIVRYPLDGPGIGGQPDGDYKKSIHRRVTHGRVRPGCITPTV